MNIKIIEPYDLNTRYDFRSLTPNSGPIVIATMLKQKGHSVEVISEYVSKFRLKDIKEADLVGISITTYNARKGFEFARRIEKPIVFGGFHATLMPEECLRYGDYVIRGDGHPIIELVDYLDNKEGKEINRIPNLVYKKNGKAFYNQRETKAINIAPDFSLVKDYYKLNLNRLLRIPLLAYASRGCQHNCLFCSITEVYTDFQRKDKKTVIEDIESQIRNQPFLSRFLPQFIWLTDDNFTSDIEWAKDLLRDLAKLNKKYQFAIQARVDIAYDDELLELMRDANMVKLAIGFESLKQQSLDNFHKGTSLKDIEKTIKKIKSYGMDIFALFVLGDDQYEKGDGLKISEFLRKNNFCTAFIQPLTPFPGTKLYKKLKNEGRILHQDWQDYNGKVVFRPKNMTPAELQEEIYTVYRKVYSPLNLLRCFILEKKRLNYMLLILGESFYRHFEWLKSRRYIKDKLSKFS